MYVYYFQKSIERNGHIYGDYFESYFTNCRDLIREASCALRMNGDTLLTEKEMDSITSVNLPDFDFYAVQGWCDGFGNNTYTLTITKTYEDAEEYISQRGEGGNYKIIGQWFFTPYRNAFE